MTIDRLTYRHRRPGLDHDSFIHEATFKRPAIAWPGHKRIALWITVPIEFFPLDAPTLPVCPLGGLDRGYPDFWGYSNRDYGTRIGVYRIMRVLDALGLRATAAVNAVVATHYPRIIEELCGETGRLWRTALIWGTSTTESLSWKRSGNLFREREIL